MINDRTKRNRMINDGKKRSGEKMYGKVWEDYREDLKQQHKEASSGRRYMRRGAEVFLGQTNVRLLVWRPGGRRSRE